MDRLKLISFIASLGLSLAGWFSIPDQELDIVAPGIDNFVSRDLNFIL